MSKQSDQDVYRIYLLTVTYSSSVSNQGWRFLIEDPHTGSRKGYLGIEELIDGLRSTIFPESSSSSCSEPLDSASSHCC